MIFNQLVFCQYAQFVNYLFVCLSLDVNQWHNCRLDIHICPAFLQTDNDFSDVYHKKLKELIGTPIFTNRSAMIFHNHNIIDMELRRLIQKRNIGRIRTAEHIIMCFIQLNYDVQIYICIFVSYVRYHIFKSHAY